MKAVRLALALSVLDLAAVVLSGGFSFIGEVSVRGFAVRLSIAGLLLALDFFLHRRPRPASLYGYAALLLILLPLLHFRGYRLRGDGLWYYSLAHSLAFDRDVDLSNQYLRLGIETMSGSRPVRETGLPRFTFPVGAPVAWAPFLALGHAGAALRNAHGRDTAYDGFSDPYFHAVALANLLIGWAGLLVLDRILRRWFFPWIAFLAVSGTALGSFLVWYLTYHAIYTHALTFSLATLFVKLWIDGPKNRRDYAALGLVLGLSVLVRWQNAVLVLLPAWTLSRELRRERRISVALSSGASFGVAALFAVLPQLLIWKAIFDRFYVGVPLGADYMRWGDPFLTEILFSSRHGLFAWSPLLLVSAIGFLGFLRREPRLGFPLAALGLVVWYVNSVVADWWGGGSFGGRRFDSILPLFALGLGAAISWASGMVERHPRWVLGGALAAAILSNGLLMEQYRKERLPPDDTISWETAAEGKLEDLFDAVGYPFSFPMNWLFALRYDRPKTQYDILVGKYLFHRMLSLEGLIELGVNDPPFIGNGWTGLRDWKDRAREVRFAEGDRAGIFVPIYRAEPLRLFVNCAAPEGAPPVAIEVLLNGTRIGDFVPGTDMAEQALTAEASLWRRVSLIEFVPVASGKRSPYLAVDRLRFERLEP
jgi:hypothetical protein